MKIYSFDGKKSNIDNFDINSSPLYMGRRFVLDPKPVEQDTGENEKEKEKQIEK